MNNEEVAGLMFKVKVPGSTFQVILLRVASYQSFILCDFFASWWLGGFIFQVRFPVARPTPDGSGFGSTFKVSSFRFQV